VVGVLTACTGSPGEQRRLLATTLRIGREEGRRKEREGREEEGAKVKKDIFPLFSPLESNKWIFYWPR